MFPPLSAIGLPILRIEAFHLLLFVTLVPFMFVTLVPLVFVTPVPFMFVTPVSDSSLGYLGYNLNCLYKLFFFIFGILISNALLKLSTVTNLHSSSVLPGHWVNKADI